MTVFHVSPQRVTIAERMIAGLNRAYVMGHQQGIPAQWDDYNAAGDPVGDLVPDVWYGVCHAFDGAGGFEYLCGMQARSVTGLPEGTATVTLPGGDYAVFATKAHISTMQAIWAEIYSHWLKQPGWQARPGPSVEMYPFEFDGASGEGGFEIWVPVV